MSDDAVAASESRPQPLYVVPHRPGRQSARFLPPVLILTVGLVVLAYRAGVSDWRGLQFSGWSGSKPTLARAEDKPTPPRTTHPQPADVKRPAVAAPAPATTKEKAAAKDTPKVKETPRAKDAWDDIRREADRKKAEAEDLNRLKEKAVEEARKAPVRPFAPNPQWQQQQQQQMVQQMMAQAQVAFAQQRFAFGPRQAGQMAQMQQEFDRLLREQRVQFDRLRAQPGVRVRRFNFNGPGNMAGFQFQAPGNVRGFQFRWQGQFGDMAPPAQNPGR